MHAPVLRCLTVALAAGAVSAALVAWLVPVAVAPAPGFDGAVVRLCAAVGALAATWLGASTVAVAAEALRGATRATPGVPAPVRRLVLAACGVAVVAGLASPAGAASGRQDQPQTAASVVASALAGLPLPDRAEAGHAPLAAHQHPRPNQRPTTVTVRPGDTLWSIAEERLGSGGRWPRIYELNRAVVGADPDLIRPAQRLRLPLHPHEGEKR